MCTVAKRRIDELGRIVLPQDARAAMKLSVKDAVDISWEDDKIIIKKAKPTCKLCGSEENVKESLGICQACISKIEIG